MRNGDGIKDMCICNLCHSKDRRTIDILNTNLHSFLEKLTHIKIEDETNLCFVCHRRLQQCHAFVSLVHENIEVQEEYRQTGKVPNSVHRKCLANLSLCTVMNFKVPYDTADNMIGTVIKEEREIKEEPESGVDEDNSEEEPGDDSEEELEDESEEEPENESEEEPENESEEEPENDSEEEPKDESEEELLDDIKEEPEDESEESEDDLPLKAMSRKRTINSRGGKKETQVKNKKIKKS